MEKLLDWSGNIVWRCGYAESTLPAYVCIYIVYSFVEEMVSLAASCIFLVNMSWLQVPVNTNNLQDHCIRFNSYAKGTQPLRSQTDYYRMKNVNYNKYICHI